MDDYVDAPRGNTDRLGEAVLGNPEIFKVLEQEVSGVYGCDFGHVWK